jgi:hypothetical protein
VKIVLPADLSRNHHVFFSFYHASVDDAVKGKKQAKGQTKEGIPIGHAWIPLIVDGAVIEDSDHEIQVACSAATAKYANGVMLPARYNEARSVGMGQTVGPPIKWLDSKPLFQVRMTRFSTVRSASEQINSFFRPGAATLRRDSLALNTVHLLRNASAAALFLHLPIILNQLFRLLIEGPLSTMDLMAASIVDTLLFLVRLVHTEMPFLKGVEGENTLLRSYVYNTFVAPLTPGDEGRSVHEDLAKYLCNIIQPKVGTLKADGDSLDSLLRHSWFFFQIMSKSMAQFYARKVAREAGAAVPRAQRFPATYQAHLVELVTAVAGSVVAQVNTNIVVCKAVNNNVAFFLQSCFSTMDRGHVYDLIQRYLRALSNPKAVAGSAENLMLFKMHFLQILCEHEHFVPLNLVGAAIAPVPALFPAPFPALFPTPFLALF